MLCEKEDCVLRQFLCSFFQAEDGIRVGTVTGVQTCALPISTAITRAWPSASTACSFLISALRLDIRHTPVANTSVITIGRPSGMMDTARDTTAMMARER